MQTATPSNAPAPPADEDEYGPPDIRRRNFYAWIAYQFFYRIGWQFKMESTLMAGIVSYLAPSPAVMGLFTTLNTLGRNLSPLAAAPIVDRFRDKRRALLVFWGITTATWAALTAYLWLPSAGIRAVSIWVFGFSYTLFFVFLGAASVAQGALLGKIIPAGMRGRAMAVGMTLSGGINVGAIFLIYHVIRGGAFPEPRNYALAFSLTVTFFLFAGLSLLLIRERPSEVQQRSLGLAASLRYFVKLGRENDNLRKLMLVNITVGVLGSMLQFYTGYWREAGTMTPSALVMATVFQVFWQSLSSSILGRVADSKGNRVVICSLLWIEVTIPVAAWVLGGWAPFRGHWEWYLGVYALVGLRFPLYQLLVNYLLEVVPQHDHAMALGAVTTVQLVTAPAPLLFGAAAAWMGYPLAFMLGSAIGVYGAIAALRLQEVRVLPLRGAG
ncbi:MAG TPA: MFS transporter [Armatimonadota bacterium]|nr:MFS transporter [Armatimonadota bacterium]